MNAFKEELQQMKLSDNWLLLICCCNWSLVFICSLFSSITKSSPFVHFIICEAHLLLEIPGPPSTIAYIQFFSTKPERRNQTGACLSMCIFVSLSAHKVHQRDETFGTRVCVSGCEVIICVCFERWMNGVKIALICRGTVLPSGLMSVPG